MTMQLIGHVDLPAHTGKGGFDHAAVHAASGLVYVAHTANGAVDVFDPTAKAYLCSIPELTAVAGVIVSDEANLVIATNRGEDTIGIFGLEPVARVIKVKVGVRPNGAAFDPVRRRILVANVGDASRPGTHTLTMVDLDAEAVLTEIPVPGRTRWAVYDSTAEAFYVNIADPARIIVVDARKSDAVARAFTVPAVGPHGLDIDLRNRRLFCACDDRRLVILDADSGKVLGDQPLSGEPDVVFFNPARQQLYVASGDPGVIDVFDTDTMAHLGAVATERGCHTIAFDPSRARVYAFLPETHRAAIYRICEEFREDRP
jgi:DNA-binding beta-propeller fold protein YncE